MSSYPDVVRIEPSSACNLRCIHCPTGILQGDRGIMSEETFNTIFEDIRYRVPRVVVMYHGGEPLLCKDLWVWIARLKDLGVKHIRTVTNGTLLTTENIKRIINCGLDELAVSIDGQSPEESNSIRIGSDTYKILDSIRELLSLKNSLRSNTPTIHINNAQFTNRVNTKMPTTPQFLLDAFKDYEEHILCKSIYVVNWGLKGMMGKSTYVGKDNYCPNLSETMTVRWNGDIVPCCVDITSQCVLGNIYNSKLEEIWDNELYEKIRSEIREGKPLGICKECIGD